MAHSFYHAPCFLISKLVNGQLDILRSQWLVLLHKSLGQFGWMFSSPTHIGNSEVRISSPSLASESLGRKPTSPGETRRRLHVENVSLLNGRWWGPVPWNEIANACVACLVGNLCFVEFVEVSWLLRHFTPRFVDVLGFVTQLKEHFRHFHGILSNPKGRTLLSFDDFQCLTLLTRSLPLKRSYFCRFSAQLPPRSEAWSSLRHLDRLWKIFAPGTVGKAGSCWWVDGVK